MKDFTKRAAAVVIAALVLGGIAWKVASKDAVAAPTVASQSGELYAERQVGNATAPVRMVEYFSLTCPHCAKFEQETFPKLKAEYIDTGKVLFVSRAFPIDKAGLEAAEMARCAPADHYFALVDWLFKGQEQWGLSNDPLAAMRPLGKFAGMSDATLDACFANKDLQDFLVGIRQQASEKYKVDSTPTFVFNDGADKITGAETYDKFKSSIDALLAGK